MTTATNLPSSGANHAAPVLPYKFIKFVNPAGCGDATGWDGAHLDGKHACGYEMRVSLSRSMRSPTLVRYSSTIDGSQHFHGTFDNVGKDALSSIFDEAWHFCSLCPAQYR